VAASESPVVWSVMLADACAEAALTAGVSAAASSKSTDAHSPPASLQLIRCECERTEAFGGLERMRLMRVRTRLESPRSLSAGLRKTCSDCDAHLDPYTMPQKLDRPAGSAAVQARGQVQRSRY
jgi:hypothetical protein